MLLGLTGGIATGKTTVSNLLKKRGAFIVDADQIARQVVEPGTQGAERIRERFGDHLFDHQGRLDRKQLGTIIFQDEQARKDLNALLHPLIREEMKRQTKRIQDEKKGVHVIWDVPLLYEGELTEQVEKVIVVYIPETLQIQRLMQRNQYSRNEAINRIRSQRSIEYKKQLADFLIDNSGSYENTERQVDQLWNCLTSKNGLSQP